MPKLLVSVRSVLEAEEALAGGADLIDVKEPSRGSLGRADDAVVAAIVKHIAGRVPTSAALGELADWDGTMPSGVDFVKAGLAGLGATDWRARLDALREAGTGRTVIVAYADWIKAAAPPFDSVIAYAETTAAPVLLIDTYFKTGSTLFDLRDGSTLRDAITRMRAADGRIALAGSLSQQALRLAAALEPDWVAVRSAVCEGGRIGTVRRERVCETKRHIAESQVIGPTDRQALCDAIGGFTLC